MQNESENRIVRRASYFLRHWRGELSLPVSYFVNGLFLNFALVFLLTVVSSELLSGIHSATPLVVAVVGIWAFALLVTLWQIVGIWRSADRHPSRGGSKFWAGVAKFMVILSVVVTCGQFFGQGVPQLKESFKIAAGDADMGTHELRLLNGGREIEFSGGITFGVTAELKRLLDASPDVHTVHLNSLGGRVGEAQAMRDLLRARGLDTYSSGSCLSACTVAFLGGRKRYVNSDTRFGFHASDFPGIPEDELRAANRELVEEAVARGVDRRFAEKAYFHPHETMWFPTTDELMRAHVATDIAQGQFSLSGLGADPSREMIATTVRNIPLFATLSRLEPEWFDKTIDVFYGNLYKGLPENQLYARARASISELIVKYLPLASDEAVLAFGNLAAEQLGVLAAKDQVACYHFLFPEEGPFVNVSDYFDNAMQARELQVVEMVFATAAVGQPREINPERVAELFLKIFTSMALAENSDALTLFVAAAEDPNSIDKEQMCDFSLQTFTHIMALPEDEAVELMRAMFVADA